MKIAIGCDHNGFALKKALLQSALKDVGVEDLGVFDENPSDYPDIAFVVAEAVAKGRADRGILICGTGIGMAIAANKIRGVRAAAVSDVYSAKMSRKDNDANVLCLGGRVLGWDLAAEIVTAWLREEFEGGRHLRRLEKIHQKEQSEKRINKDPEVHRALCGELERQQYSLELIASENFASRAVLEAQGSVMTNKYAEGYPHKRYYGGCQYMDVVEELARERLKALFKAEHANVQPHSGTQANMAVYLAVLKPGDVLMGMALAHGGHLSHGHSANFSGRLFKAVSYGVSRETERIDYDEMRKLALQHKPKLIVAGASAYPREIDFKKIKEICDEVGAYFLADIAHIAGLISAGLHQSPVPYADFITTTTHKTLRGPRGGAILCKRPYAQIIDKTVFPGIQGGPLMHVIAAKAVAFKEALTEEFKEYQRSIVRNARALARALEEQGFRLVSGGTDNHLILVDLTSKNITGADAERHLEEAGIYVNKNAIPFDPRKPAIASGIRLGTPAVTTRGMGEPQMHEIAQMISSVLDSIGTKQESAVKQHVRRKVRELCEQFPLYQEVPTATL